MNKQVVIYCILSIIFIAGSIYNFKIRKQCIYPTRLTKPRCIIILIIPLIFLSMTYFISDGRLANYILVVLGSIFVISPVLAEGISEKGIYHLSLGTKSTFVRLAKWEDIKDFKLNENKGKLESIKLKTRTIFPDQYYHLENVLEINKYIEMKVKDN